MGAALLTAIEVSVRICSSCLNALPRDVSSESKSEEVRWAIFKRNEQIQLRVQHSSHDNSPTHPLLEASQARKIEVCSPPSQLGLLLMEVRGA